MSQNSGRTVLIVSSHPLFGKGIEHLLVSRQGFQGRVVGIVSTVDEAVNAINSLEPDLVVVDYDDGAVNREEFLARFVESQNQMRVVLFSLKEGGSKAVVYDRRNLEASQIDDWLREWSAGSAGSDGLNDEDGSNLLEKRRNNMTNGGNKPSNGGLKHAMGVLAVIAVLTAAFMAVLRTDILLPEAASAQALPIDTLFGYHFLIIALLFALVLGAIIYSAIFFRRKPGEEDPTYERGDDSYSVSWVVFPMTALFVFVLLHLGTFSMNLYATLLPSTPLSFDVASGLVSLAVGLVVYLVFFTPGRGAHPDAETTKENNRLEVTWTALPLGAVLIFSMIGADNLATVIAPAPKAVEIKVIGQQWAWRFEYPAYGVTSDTLVMPVNRQALLRLTSDDVIHSFWVPEFRVKQDAVPGVFKDLRITPNKEDKFSLICSEICGTRHAYMIADVEVVSEEAFTTWIASQQVPEDPVARGAYWYKNQGCASCHSIDGTKIVGPSFLGLFGREEVLIDNSIVIADEAYIKESILDPYAKIVATFETSPDSGISAMPNNYAEKLTAEQIDEIILWIKTLK